MTKFVEIADTPECFAAACEYFDSEFAYRDEPAPLECFAEAFAFASPGGEPWSSRELERAKQVRRDMHTVSGAWEYVARRARDMRQVGGFAFDGGRP